MWTFIKTLIICLWLVSTVLLVRHEYFPETDRMAPVPIRAVMKAFLEHGAEQNSMHLFHDGQKIGFAAANAKVVAGDKGEKDYTMQIAGTIEKGGTPWFEGTLSWRLDLKLKNGEDWNGMKGFLRMPDEMRVVDFNWERGQRFPHFVARQKGVITLTDENPMVTTALMGMGTGMVPLPGGMTMPTTEEGLLKVDCHQGLLTLGGQKTRVNVIELTFMEQYSIRAFFTELGELAIVEMPEGYRLMNDVIYNLEPGIGDDEEGKKKGT